jgi:hypothetical protein
LITDQTPEIRAVPDGADAAHLRHRVDATVWAGMWARPVL